MVANPKQVVAGFGVLLLSVVGEPGKSFGEE